ncbi:MAG: hypothetical protein CMO07_08005 [Thalassospira sp.]|uniref:DUF2235 domain-containing protein n=1 Tax=Thalassospira sp. UBA4513 TaxID=1947675 RepID=UPI000C43D4E1|nr:DUF2235 domain-containing protein [Thalassospira sp. UBA4513]MBE70671.1 hypothetical protein [Thalassospira sp.]|tara:strand:+ start:451 stop:1704 length:1254 start_codon:yes stop_codon:yes gene_type:complete
MAKRRLIVFFDGTWQEPANTPEPTNVVKLLRAVPSSDKDVSQIVFYDRGVGTGDVIDKIRGGAFGNGLLENVVDGYRFLGNNYQPGDEIFIFGFSRGAFTARSLAGLIGLCGLLKPPYLGHPLQTDIAKIVSSDLSPEAKRTKISTLDIETQLDVPIECVGVWDTVGSLGIPGDLGRRLIPAKYHFYDVQLGGHVRVALHAMAIDEKRSAFSPTLWVKEKGTKLPDKQIVEQVWFPGVHSNVGGSYDDCRLSDITLDWMIKRVKKHTKLKLDESHLKTKLAPSVDGRGYESRTMLYSSSRLYPYQRLIEQIAPETRNFWDKLRIKCPNFDRRNIIPDGLETINEAIHVSALVRWNISTGVLHDNSHEGSLERVLYRPSNLNAVLKAHYAGKRTPNIINWTGATMRKDIPWPDQSTLE